MKQVSDEEHKELSPQWVYEIFEENYMNKMPYFTIDSCHFKQNDGIMAETEINFGGKKTIVDANGNGRLDAVSNTIKQFFGISYELSTYEEHALSHGSSSKAIAYVGITCDGKNYWGVGMDEDIIKASIHALTVAVNKLPQIAQNDGAQDERLTAMLNFIQNNYQGVTLESMAAQFHLSEPYISKYIKDKSGKTFGEHVAHIRMKRAKTLLKNGNMTVENIADVVGYPSVEHFNRTFKKCFDRTPLQYRNESPREKIKSRRWRRMYDVIIIGAGPGGIFSAYELMKQDENLKIAVFDAGHSLEQRHCPIDGEKVKSCISCKTCAIMNGFGGAGAFSDGKYNITNDFGGTLYEYIGRQKALELMKYVDTINMSHGGEGTKMYSTAGTDLKKVCLQNKLKLLDASVRHLGTDVNYVVLKNLYDEMKEHMDFFFDTPVEKIQVKEDGYTVSAKDAEYACRKCIVSVGRSGSKWMETVCEDLEIPTKSNRVDIGVRVELPAVIFSHLTDELYESKIVYRTEKFEDNVRTFCMNPYGIVVNENTNGIVTVNGHSYDSPDLRTENTNFALLVAKHFSEPFKDSNGYGESIARLSNMLGGGVIVQRFGDLVRGRRSNQKRIEEGLVTPTLSATPGDLSLVLPKRILDGIMEMIYALDKIAPGTANDDTLLYGVEVKFYNMEVELDENLQSRYPGLYIIGDGSGVTHSLSHASASGVYVARHILESEGKAI